MHMQLIASALAQLDDGQTYWVRPSRRSRGKHAMRAGVEGRTCEQLVVTGKMKFPNDEQMREALNVCEPSLKLGKNPEHSVRVMLCTRTLGYFASLFVGTAYESDRSRRE